MKTLLKIINLSVQAGKKKILDKVNLEIKQGQNQILLGPNASGKSTLAQTILGNPKYKITKGKIIFLGKDITKISPEKRAKMGLALTWQSPPSIQGIKLSTLLKKISNGPFSIEPLKVEHLLKRGVNQDLSGGEKKFSELLQLITQKPILAILDEIDSGLDIKKLEVVSKLIKQELIKKKTTILMITHRGEILKFLKPYQASVMLNGSIICKSKNLKKVLATIKKYGYEKCKRCLQKI